MSILCKNTAGWLLDHLAFLRTAHPYCPAEAPGGQDMQQQRPRAYSFRADFFQLLRPHLANSLEEASQKPGSDQQQPAATKKHKRRCSALNQGELDALEYHTKISGLIMDGSKSLIQEGLKRGFLHPNSGKWENCSRNISAEFGYCCRLAELCEMAKQLNSLDGHEPAAHQAMDEIKMLSNPELELLSRITENNTDRTKLITLLGQKYLLPPKSNFLLSDISCMQPLLQSSKKYDVIVIDPPWQNKSVKRSKREGSPSHCTMVTSDGQTYSPRTHDCRVPEGGLHCSNLVRYGHLSSWQIQQIPIPELAAADCLVITWVTNRQKHLRFVKDDLYPHWSVEVLAEWHWVKITRAGQFVFPLDSTHKKPYEVLVLGRCRRSTDSPSRGSCRICQARSEATGAVCSQSSAWLDQLGERGSQIPAHRLFHFPGDRKLTKIS
ncbi:methyltransferase-like protein 4 isoform X2 [Rhinatrema bivittatum]|uniref:methyltransferase-like protein 4 isoform X2 n=1 Tax=Rhinatrema bivittatum TaxID=194408 RepID=UPI001127A76F|nr:methyltransferase-like protein 4 isoform X2 [Rhinatrema bivittatum]